MPPLSLEQLEIRTRGIGSSEIAALCGESPWRNAHDVWLEKLGLAEPFEGNDATWLGNELEPIIAKRYAQETGAEITHGPGTKLHPENPWALASTDYEWADRSRVVECKLVGIRAMHHWTMDADGAPTYVQLQAQWQCYVREIERADVAVIFGGTAEFRIYEFTRDNELISALVTIAKRFWETNILERVAPPIDGSESARATLSALYPSNRRPLLPAPPEAEQWFLRRAKAVEEGKAAEAEKDLATNKLIEMIGDADGIEGNFGVVTFKKTKAGRRAIRVWARNGEQAA